MLSGNGEKEISDFLAALESANWQIDLKNSSTVELSEEIQSRFPDIPNSYKRFLATVSRCHSGDDTTWFLCEDNYNRNDNLAFRWDEWEQLSLNAADMDNDEEWANRIRVFWDRHLPIMLSVKDGYAYVAVVFSGKNIGHIVCGREPEFEEAREVCGSFDHLMVIFTEGVSEALAKCGIA